MLAELDEASLVKANAQFWEPMIAMRLEPVASTEEFCVGPGHLIGSVSLYGLWKGRIEVRMAAGLALAATAAMLMQPAETVTEADTLDATKEIANIIGGVIKSSLPNPCTLNVPESSVAADGMCMRPRTADVLAVAFRHNTGSLLLRVWEEACG
ncbi:MAG: chemotaxis protein CheX [Terracidiphilus sp.]